MSFQAEFDTQEVTKYLNEMLGKLGSIDQGDIKFAKIISAIVYRDVMDHFKRQEGETGAWKEWSDSYQTFMARIGKSGNNILQDTGKLRNSFAPGNYKRTSKGLVWFNNARTRSGFPYAYAHDNATEKRSTLPRREFMWLSKDAMGDIAIRALEYVTEDK